jgi:hypothetical protein
MIRQSVQRFAEKIIRLKNLQSRIDSTELILL